MAWLEQFCVYKYIHCTYNIIFTINLVANEEISQPHNYISHYFIVNLLLFSTVELRLTIIFKTKYY